MCLCADVPVNGLKFILTNFPFDYLTQLIHSTNSPISHLTKIGCENRKNIKQITDITGFNC